MEHRAEHPTSGTSNTHRQPVFEHPVVQFEIENARLHQDRRVVVKDPGAKFCLDRFGTLPVREQVSLLADIALARQEDAGAGVPLSFEVRTILARLGRSSTESFSKDEVTSYYLSFAPKALELWLEEGIRHPGVRDLVLERMFSHLHDQLPAISFTLAHIYSGGFYGLLTARANRDAHLPTHVRHLSEQFGFAPQTELVYFVNDPVLGKRLNGIPGGTADRKATVLSNFVEGKKRDEHGHLVPMTLGKRFNEVIFIDDEDKNLRAAVLALVNGVAAEVLQSVSVVGDAPQSSSARAEKCREIAGGAYDHYGVAATSDPNFWTGIVDELRKGALANRGGSIDSEQLISELRATGRWLPDAIKVFDGRSLPIGPSIEILRSFFYSKEPLVLGSRPSVLFNDIDRTLLSVDARFHLRDFERPDEEPILSISQEDFAQHPTEEYWIAEAARRSGVPIQKIVFDWRHFLDPLTIRQDILAALFNGNIARNPHKTSGRT
jgi:hypothetical protein